MKTATFFPVNVDHNHALEDGVYRISVLYRFWFGQEIMPKMTKTDTHPDNIRANIRNPLSSASRDWQISVLHTFYLITQ